MSAELRSGHNNNTTCSVFCQVIFLTEYGYVIVSGGLTGFGVILNGRSYKGNQCVVITSVASLSPWNLHVYRHP